MQMQCVLVVLVALLPLGVEAQDISRADSTAIFAALERWEEAWRVHDVGLATVDYSADADFTNAFGMRRIGQPEIHALLDEVFGLPFVMAGDTEYEYHDIQVLTPDVVLVRSRAIRVGQESAAGIVEAPRRTNHLRVFERQAGGWLIVSHLVGDERSAGAGE